MKHSNYAGRDAYSMRLPFNLKKSEKIKEIPDVKIVKTNSIKKKKHHQCHYKNSREIMFGMKMIHHLKQKI